MEEEKKGKIGNQATGNQVTGNTIVITITTQEGKRRESTSLHANFVRKQIILKHGVGPWMYNVETISNLDISKSSAKTKSEIVKQAQLADSFEVKEDTLFIASV